MRETREARLGAICCRRLWPVGDEAVGKAPVGALDGGLGDIADPAAALSEINQRYALAPLSPEAVELRQMALANDRVDRTFERFSPAFLERLGQTLDPALGVRSFFVSLAGRQRAFVAQEEVFEAQPGDFLRLRSNRPISLQLEREALDHAQQRRELLTK